MKRIFFLLSIILITAVQLAWGQIPPTISYQGVLTDTDGAGIPDGAYSLTFNLYNAVAGGSSLWSETQAVPVEQGIFNVILGAVNPLNLPFDKPAWLGVTVGDGAELTPRIELTASPYSLNTRSIPDNIVGSAKLADGAVTSGKIASGQVVKSLNSLQDDVTLAAGTNVTITASGDTLTINATGGAGDGHSLDAADSDPVDAVFVDNDGKVGVGTTSPITKLHVSGGDINIDLNQVFRIGNERVLRRDGSGVTVGGNLVVPLMLQAGNEHMRITTAGNVGIGTTNPGAKLDIAGDIKIVDGTQGSGKVLTSDASGLASWQTPSGSPGGDWSLTGNSGITAANFIGTTDNQALNFRVNNEQALRLEPASDATLGSRPNLIGGHSSSNVSTGVVGATISGGGPVDTGEGLDPNQVTDHFGSIGGGAGNQAGDGFDNDPSDAQFATVGGGKSNTASGAFTTVGGGENNTAGGLQAIGGIPDVLHATVAGGFSNQATGGASVVGGGFQNTAGALASTVPGGRNNSAMGNNSLAAGQRAKANHDGTFVWADATPADFASTGINQFLIRASGGVGIGTNDPAAASFVVQGQATSGLDFISTAQNSLTTGHLATVYDLDENRWILRVSGVAAPLTFAIQASERMRIMPSGNVGIGVTNPTETLEVAGNIRATGYTQSGTGGETLRIVRGDVNTGGVRVGGSGFNASRTATGVYVITFLTPFSVRPTVTVTPLSTLVAVATADAGTAASFTVRIFDSSGAALDRGFSFIAIGIP